MDDDKTADERPEAPALVPQAHGGALLSGGKPGNRGGGRPPDEFNRRMRELASSEAALAYLEECLTGVHGPKAHASAMAFAAERGYGKVPQALEHTGKDGAPLVVRIIGAE